MSLLLDIALAYIEAKKQVPPLECCDRPSTKCHKCPKYRANVAAIKEVLESGKTGSSKTA